MDSTQDARASSSMTDKKPLQNQPNAHKRKRGRPKLTLSDAEIRARKAARFEDRCRSKRFNWSNALHVRFLIATMDWAIAKVDAEKLLNSMGEPMKSLLSTEDLKIHLKRYSEASAAERKAIINLSESMVKEDYKNNGVYVVPLKSEKKVEQLKFTEYPITFRPVPAFSPDELTRMRLKEEHEAAAKKPHTSKKTKKIQKQQKKMPKETKVLGHDTSVKDVVATPIAMPDNASSFSHYHHINTSDIVQRGIIDAEMEMQRFTSLHRRMVDRHEAQMQKYGGTDMASVLAADATQKNKIAFNIPENQDLESPFMFGLPFSASPAISPFLPLPPSVQNYRLRRDSLNSFDSFDLDGPANLGVESMKIRASGGEIIENKNGEKNNVDDLFDFLLDEN